MNLSSLDAFKDHLQDEFMIKTNKLKKDKSKLVKPPSVAASPVNLECKLFF